MISKTIISEAIAGRMPVKYKHEVYSTGCVFDATTGKSYTMDEYEQINPKYAEFRLAANKALGRSMIIMK